VVVVVVLAALPLAVVVPQPSVVLVRAERAAAQAGLLVPAVSGRAAPVLVVLLALAAPAVLAPGRTALQHSRRR